MRDNHGDNNIFDKDDALDFMIYTELEKQEQEPKNDKGGCFGVVVLMLLPAAGCLFVNWKF